MYALRSFFNRLVATPGSDPASDYKHPLFEDSEKAQHILNNVPSPSLKSRTGHRKISLVIKLFFLACALVFTLFFGQPILNYATLGYHSILRNSKPHDHVPCSHDVDADNPVSIAAPPVDEPPVGAKLLDRANWSAICSSNNDAGAKNNCEFAIKETDKKFWRSDDVTDGTHWIEIDLKQKVNVHSLRVSPSLSLAKKGGRVQKHRIEVATEKGKFFPVAFGTWQNNAGAKNSTFEPREAQYVKLTVIDTTLNKPFVEIGNIEIFIVDKIQTSPAPNAGGRWSLTLTFPLVPVTAFMNPISHNLTIMAAVNSDSFSQNSNPPKTITATWDPQKQVIEEKVIGNTKHEMFCPGTSFDEKGNLFITGGSDPSAVTLYDSASNQWSTPKDKVKGQGMKLIVGRGYHGQTYLPDGNTFMIGGQWSGDKVTPRDAELYDAKAGTMRKLEAIKASIIDMAPGACVEKYKDKNCINHEWKEHHPWLYAWKNDTVFHAGPSKQMNWIYTNGADGAYMGAGTRKDDGDAVCGIAAMYDAAGGIILSAGGAPNYHYWAQALEGPQDPEAPHRYESTKNAYEIKLGTGAPGAVTVDKVTSMNHQRIFANSVILPTGQTLVVGGQKLGEPFHDETWEPIPEIYTPGSPATWTDVAPHSTPRVYHSWALLLPNATVLVGGGGLRSDRWWTNHYDAQIYEPPYLFEPDGSAKPRPTIGSIDKPNAPYKVGEKIIITTDVEVDATASLIRYSAATHSLNNDLRRIKLTLKPEGVAGTNKKYSAELPKEPGVALPGYWMLFVLRDGAPSHSETVQILA